MTHHSVSQNLIYNGNLGILPYLTSLNRILNSTFHRPRFNKLNRKKSLYSFNKRINNSKNRLFIPSVFIFWQNSTIRSLCAYISTRFIQSRKSLPVKFVSGPHKESTPVVSTFRASSLVFRNSRFVPHSEVYSIDVPPSVTPFSQARNRKFHRPWSLSWSSVTRRSPDSLHTSAFCQKI